MWWKALAEHVIHDADDYPGGRPILWECDACGGTYAEILSRSRQDPEEEQIFGGGLVTYVLRCARCGRCETVVIGWKGCIVEVGTPLGKEEE